MANRRSTFKAPRPNIVADIGLKDIGLSYEMQKSIDSLDEKITPTEFSLSLKLSPKNFEFILRFTNFWSRFQG